jgi:hypothetical protein
LWEVRAVADVRVRVDSGALLEDLRGWMGGIQGVEATAVPRQPGANSQGGVWDFLALACATGGPLAAAVRALQMWVEARVTTIEVEAGGRRFTVTGPTAQRVLPEVIAAVRALEAAGQPEPPAPEAPGARPPAAEAADGQA